MIAWVLPIIASVVMFRFITLPNYGFINILLKDLGLGHLARNWFGDEKYAFVLILIMHLWRNVPFYAISFMAAMQAIPVRSLRSRTDRRSIRIGDNSITSRYPICVTSFW